MSVEEINRAIGFHTELKKKLQNAVITGNSALTPVLISHHDLCTFGEWLNNLDPECISEDKINKVKKLHIEFHKVASEILNLALTGKKTEALIKLSFQGSFNTAANNLMNDLEAWRKEIVLNSELKVK